MRCGMLETFGRNSEIPMTTKTPLRDHQTEAEQAITAEFRTTNRTTLVMPCGTGKTLVGAAIGAEWREVLLLFPSISLIRQTLDVWRAEGVTNDRRLLVVCSDKQAADSDDVMVTEQELGCHITTSIEEVREFFERPENCLVLTTYHSTPLVAEALPPGYQFDIAIFDEAHRTAQANNSQFTVALQDEAIPCARRLFMTATPRFGALAGSDNEYSMNNEQVYGRICHQLSHQDAVERGLICGTQTIIGATSNKELKRFFSGETDLQKNTSALVNIGQAISIRRAMDTFGVKKVVTFHRTVAEAEQFNTQANVREELGVPCFFIHGRMASNEREQILREFDAAEAAVISNARCLTEGIDVPSIDMVAFMSPKRSVVDVVQAVGRSARNAPNKTTGYVLIPLVAKLQDGEIDKSQFNEVFNILTSLIEEASVIAYKSGTRVGNYNWRKSVADKLGDYSLLAHDMDTAALRDQIQVYCESRSTHTFDYWYPILCEQFQTHGQPLTGKARSQEQVTWERYIRAVHREGRLSAEKERLLTAINFQWSRSQEDRWEEHYVALKQYVLEKKGRRNERFLAEQRNMFRAGTLPKERAERLMALGLILAPQRPSPKRHYAPQKPIVRTEGEAKSADSPDASQRIDDLQRVFASYDRGLSGILDSESAVLLAAVKQPYAKLQKQYPHEPVFTLSALAKALNEDPETIKVAITDGNIPAPPIRVMGYDSPCWSLLHLCGIQQTLGPTMAAKDPTRAWYGALLKEEIAKAKRR